MRNMFGGMYLRPGNLWKIFKVRKLVTKNVNGYKKDTYVDADFFVRGILAEASTAEADRNKHRWDQDQHSLTHTMVVKQKYDLAKGDMLTFDSKSYLLLTMDDIAALGKSGLLYLEERNDIR